MRLSVSMIVKNEEKHLPACLESVKDADEIVIVDTGSTDSTVEIAKKYTDKVYFRAWDDSFANARNYSLRQCTGDWVIGIDADHELKSSIELIKCEIAEAEKVNAKAILVKNVYANTQTYHWRETLFKNDLGVQWIGDVHEVLSVRASYYSKVEKLIHHSPNHGIDPDRNLRILLKSEPTRRTKFYLGREYFEKRKYEESIKWMDDYLKGANWLPEVAEAYLVKARCFWILQKGDQARAACLEAIRWNPDFKESLLFMAELYYEPWKSKWKAIAKNATNKDVLFVRT